MDVFVNVTVDGDVNYDEDQFISKVKEILLDTRGWQQKGYNFVFVSKSVFDRTIVKKGMSMKFQLRLSHNTTIAKECEFDIDEKLSCYNPTVSPPNVLINYYRWMNGSAHSKLSLTDYRIYVINHEVGHALGRGHVKKCTNPGKLVQVMMQQTISIGKCRPNPWPLDE